MDLSNTFVGQSALFLPVVASFTGAQLVLRDADSLAVLFTFKFETVITSVSFSPTGEHLVAQCEDRLHVVSSSNQEEIATLDTHSCAAVKWFSDTDLAIFSEFKLHVTIWSLASASQKPLAKIQKLKCSPNAGWELHPSLKRYLVLAERHNQKDCIGIYDGFDGWKLVRHFQVDTSDLVDLRISPCGAYVAVWDSILEPAVYVYSIDGRHMCSFIPPVSTGLGIKTVSWHPQSKYLAIGDHSSQIHVVSPLTWSKIYTFTTLSTSKTMQVPVQRPPPDWIELTRASGIVPFNSVTSSFSSFHTQHYHRADPNKPFKAGIQSVAFSSSGNWLAVRDGSYPRHVFLFSLSDDVNERKGLRNILQYDQNVDAFAWRPNVGDETDVLVVTYGVQALGMWFSDFATGRAEGFAIPNSKSPFIAKAVSWSERGDALLIRGKEGKGKDAFLMAFPLTE